MIERISSSLVLWLSKEKAVSEDDKDLYIFAVSSLILDIIPIALSLLWGAILGMVLESILMISPFMLIRKFSGGYHLDSAILCFLCSSLLVALCLLATKGIINASLPLWFTLLVLAAAISLCLLSPIDNKSRRLTYHEAKVFRRITILLVSIVLLVYVVLLLGHSITFVAPIGSGLILTALLQLPCMFYKYI